MDDGTERFGAPNAPTHSTDDTVLRPHFSAADDAFHGPVGVASTSAAAILFHLISISFVLSLGRGSSRVIQGRSTRRHFLVVKIVGGVILVQTRQAAKLCVVVSRDLRLTSRTPYLSWSRRLVFNFLGTSAVGLPSIIW